MKRKITISSTEQILLIAALMYYRSTQGDQQVYDDSTALAQAIHTQWLGADPANDGPEVAILSEEPGYGHGV